MKGDKNFLVCNGVTCRPSLNVCVSDLAGFPSGAYPGGVYQFFNE